MKYLHICVFIFISTITYGQNHLKGNIKAEDKSNLENVTIQILGTNLYTQSDENGNFKLKNVPKGPLKLAFYLLGYEYKIIKQNTTNLDTSISIILIKKVQHLDEVLVSAIFNKVQTHSVMKVDHKTTEEMLKNGAFSLADGLTTIAGVSNISTGNSIGKPVIRGLSSSRVLVYTQGIRLENQQFGEEHGLGLNANGIESVEVIKGPASLLYGSDALGGVLYFNPEKFAAIGDTKINIVQQIYSNTRGTSTSFGVKGSPSNWKLLARGNYTTNEDYKIPSGDKIINTRSIEKDFKTGLGYSNSNFSSDLRYNYNNLNLGLPEEELINEGNRNPLYPKQEIDNHILSLNQKIYFKESKLEADLGYSYNNRKEFEAADEIALSMKLKTANYNVKYYFPKIKNTETIIGVQGMRQTNENFGSSLLIPNATTNDMGIFATFNYEKDQHALIAGLRFDKRKIKTENHGVLTEDGYFEAIDRTFKSLNAALGYKTDWTSKFISRINLASGFRAPNLSELTSNGVHEGSNRYEIGNTELKNEQNFQVDLNLEYKSEHVEIFVNGFYNHINNYIFIAPTGNLLEDNFVYTYLQSNAYLFGGETGIHFHPHPFDWLHFTSSFESVTGKQSNNDCLPLIPANQWKNNIRGEFTIKNWLSKGFATLQVNHTLAQNNFSAFETKTNKYTLLNIGIGGTIKLGKTFVDLTLNTNNILNKTYVNHLSRLKSDGISNMGRNFIFGINFKI
ncbi:TonB-dependent receptor [uncultured Flavobacterium sp.]|uniref:TonB-dependent receptor n=1 Tax=uncultured Flavobacterium sp. TaxID=165435 RepID=UPI0030CA3E83